MRNQLLLGLPKHENAAIEAAKAVGTSRPRLFYSGASHGPPARQKRRKISGWHRQGEPTRKIPRVGTRTPCSLAMVCVAGSQPARGAAKMATTRALAKAAGPGDSWMASAQNHRQATLTAATRTLQDNGLKHRHPIIRASTCGAARTKLAQTRPNRYLPGAAECRVPCLCSRKHVHRPELAYPRDRGSGDPAEPGSQVCVCMMEKL